LAFEYGLDRREDYEETDVQEEGDGDSDQEDSTARTQMPLLPELETWGLK
jgi:hypothetical protein